MVSIKKLNYVLLGLVSIILIVSAYSNIIMNTILPVINIPEDVLKKGDINEVASKEDLSGVATKADISEIVKGSDLETIENELYEIIRGIEEIRTTLKPTPAPTPTPMPAPPIYTIAEITLEATVVDVIKTFSHHMEPPSHSTSNTRRSTFEVKSLTQPVPTPIPTPIFPNFTPHDVYDAIVTLRIDAIIEYKSKIMDILKQGDTLELEYSWSTPYYVDGEYYEELDLKKGDRIKTSLKLLSLDEEPDLTDPTSYWWSWKYPSEVEVIE